ncbi:phage tail protein, partial [Lacticaseibacillus rhamnosus]|nr:phage tail protein [Lacticaseibacillus rhamnosus]
VWSRYVTANVGDPTNHQYSDPVCISGLDGEQGPQGPQGIPGPKGADGQTTYVHVAYANSADGSANFSVNYFPDALYIGILTDYTQVDSTDYTQYTWSRLKGDAGDQGSPGPKGADGRTTYVHFAYANSADGNTNFNTSYFSNALYVGTYTDYTPTDSGDYTKYTWSRLKGDTGATGATGPQGADGTDAPTITVKSYTFSA